METTHPALQNEVTLPVGGSQKARFWLFLAGSIYVGIGLLYSGFKGALFGEMEGLILMLVYVIQGAIIAGIGIALKPGQVKMGRNGIKVNSTKAQFEIPWNKLEQVKIEEEQIKFWDDKGLKVFPTKKMSPEDRNTLHQVLGKYDVGSEAQPTGFFDISGPETEF